MVSMIRQLVCHRRASFFAFLAVRVTYVTVALLAVRTHTNALWRELDWSLSVQDHRGQRTQGGKKNHFSFPRQNCQKVR